MTRLFPLLLALCLLPACALVPRTAPHTDPLTAEEHVVLGTAYAEQRQHTLAAEQFTKALAQDPESLAAHFALGNVLFEEGRLDEAAAHYQAILDRSPGHAGAANNLAMVYLQRRERLEEAVRLARTALAGEPAMRPYVLETLASLYLAQGNTAAAGPLVDEAMTEARQDPALYERLRQLQAEIAGGGHPPSQATVPTVER